MQRGKRVVRRGAVPHEDQVKDVASLVGQGRVLQGQFEDVE